MKIFDRQWDEERNGIFEPIPFKGDEGMLVDNRERKAMDEEDEIVHVTQKAVTQKAPEPKPEQQLFDIDSMFGTTA